MRIDSHHHLWNYSPQHYGWISESMSVLRRDFTPADLQATVEPHGVSGVVTVQARQSLEETHWLLALADANPLIRGVVGWVPLMAPEIQDVLQSLSSADRLKAVRHVVQDEPDDNFILGEEFHRGVSLLKTFDLVYDILIFAKQLRPTIQFVDRHPDQPFVLDHIAKPTIHPGRMDEAWEAAIRDLARRPQVSCKFSGVVTEIVDQGEWSLETIRPYWDVVLEAFGPSRLMFGSDWPVCLLRSQYASWVQAVEQLTAPLSETEQTAFWSGNAIQAYNL
ncbi:amidohydrolase family protein [Roseimaritima ulvae]|uniref:Amidohydrolase n=1 Tax=Roseimaritima ulvae TaxID=980254 RepID=A0A5B9R685_9BACT|nr:amidohydrolase family protein [Roseimaritima ulvae]QEG42031.1 Amidohydrolase [Roseimaritima ulvae]